MNHVGLVSYTSTNFLDFNGYVSLKVQLTAAVILIDFAETDKIYYSIKYTCFTKYFQFIYRWTLKKNKQTYGGFVLGYS